MPDLRDYERVCLFAHFDPHGLVDDVVLHYLGRLREHGFGIVFVTTAALDEAAVARARAVADEVELRPDGGLDFGSWAHALRVHGDRIRGDLLLANDSVYGPISDLGPVLDRFAATSADFMGLVESTEHEPHLQSWFLLFRPRVVRSEAFAAIFAQPFTTLDKRAVIRSGEVGLTRALTRAGFTYEALFAVDQVARYPLLCKINPSILLWRDLPVHRDVPFIKVQALRDDPYADRGVAQWRGAVDAADPGLAAMIAAHLARVQAPAPRRSGVVVALVRWRNDVILPPLRRALGGGSSVGLGTLLLYSMLRYVGLAIRRVAIELSRLVRR